MSFPDTALVLNDRASLAIVDVKSDLESLAATEMHLVAELRTARRLSNDTQVRISELHGLLELGKDIKLAMVANEFRMRCTISEHVLKLKRKLEKPMTERAQLQVQEST